MENIGCQTCAFNAHLLHKDMPFGCFNYSSSAIDLECYREAKELDIDYQKTIHENWIKNHPNWKGTPHIKYWYYCETEKQFNEFIKKYPNAEHAPNESWKSMYDEITLK